MGRRLTPHPDVPDEPAAAYVEAPDRRQMRLLEPVRRQLRGGWCLRLSRAVTSCWTIFTEVTGSLTWSR